MAGPDVGGPGTPVNDFGSGAQAVLRYLHDLLGFELAAVSRRDGDRFVVLDALDSRYGVSKGDVLAWEDTFCARMADGRAPRAAPDIGAVPAYGEAAAALGMEVGAYVTVPMTDQHGRLLGTVCAASPSTRDQDLTAHLPVIETMAGLLGTVLAAEVAREDDVRRLERLRMAAATDVLTGVGNRRMWDEALRREEARCQRYGLSAAVLLVDLDGLKRRNDEQGHSAGDALLQRAADVLRATTRGSDVVARLGGDEFGILAPAADEDAAAGLLARLRKALEAADVSASIGVGLRGPDGLDQAVAAADADMYEDKRRRRG